MSRTPNDAGRTVYNGLAGLRRGDRYLIENVAEALSEPGEWYLDRESGRLTYLPLPGETPDTVEVIAPRAEKLVLLRGDIGVGMPSLQLKQIF